MNGNKLLLDTNIILYLLDGDETLVEILDGKRPYISFITELELYSFKKLNTTDKAKIDSVLSQCTIIDINAGIKLSTINIRKKHGVKLPDAIIAGMSSVNIIPRSKVSSSVGSFFCSKHAYDDCGNNEAFRKAYFNQKNGYP